MGDYEIDGESCWFVSHDRMLEGLEANEFLDVGEHDNYLFGTTLESVRNVMAENKLCVLDVRPEVSLQIGVWSMMVQLEFTAVSERKI